MIPLTQRKTAQRSRAAIVERMIRWNGAVDTVRSVGVEALMRGLPAGATTAAQLPSWRLCITVEDWAVCLWYNTPDNSTHMVMVRR